MDLTKLYFNKKVFFSVLIILAGLIIFHRLNQSYLGGDDAYYSEIAKEMVKTGDYLTTRSGNQPDFRTSKPPLAFWMNALSGKVFGFNSLGMRFPSAVLGFLSIVAFLFFLNRYFGSYLAFMSALILTFTQQYLYHSRSAVTDGPFAAFFALAMMSFWVARTEKNNLFYYAMGFFAGCALLTRQAPGIFIFFAIFSYIFLSREFKILKNPHLYLGILLSFVIFVPWHIIMYQKYGQTFLKSYFEVTLKTGIKGYPADYNSNPSLNPWYAYLQILVNNYWPWVPFLFIGLFKIIKNFKILPTEQKPGFLFMLSWAFTPLAIFQLAKVKQFHYINPLYVPFAFFTATFFNGLKEEKKKTVTLGITAFLCFYTIACLAYPIIPKTLDSREYNDTMQMMPIIKTITDDIYVVNYGREHYYNSFLFYADKKVTIVSDDEFVSKLNSEEGAIAVMYKETFERLKVNLKLEQIKTIKETTRSLLISTKK